MGKPKPEKQFWDARAADVLAGRMSLDAPSLIALVNEVNPTGRGRDARESAARYALKARLQSLLVDRFASSLEVAADDSDPGVVSIRHRLHRHVACHAMIQALDDDARSWVQRALDIGPEDEDESGPLQAIEGDEDEVDEDDLRDADAIVKVAAAAQEEFDFERAERLLRRAFGLRPDPRTAEALLRFLVDAVAADADALGLEAALSGPARASSAVRLLLAVAAARSGEEERAARLVAGIEDPRAADVLTMIGRIALGRGDLEAAAERVAQATRIDPAHPELRSLGEDLAKAREVERAPHEAELAALVQAGRDAEATAKADALLARWPESEVARRAVRTLEARRRTEEGARLLAEGTQARDAGDLDGALALLRRALGARADEGTRSAAQRALAEVEAALRDREIGERADRALRALGGADRAGALAAYAELDDAGRARVRAKRPDDGSLAAVDAALRASPRTRKAAADAVVALEAATAHDAGDPAGALGTVASHERLVESIPAGRALLAQLRRRLAEQRRAQAVIDLAAAEQAVAAGDADRAARLLERAARDLPDDARPRGEAVRAKLGQTLERYEIGRRLDRARTLGNYDEARRAFKELAARASGDERDALLDKARRYDEEVRAKFKVKVLDLSAGAELSRGNHFHEYPTDVVSGVDLEKGTVVLPSSSAHTLFLRSYSLETGELVRAVEVVIPEDFYEPHVVVSGDRLVCIGGNGVLEISRTTGDVARWSYLRDAQRLERRMMDAILPVPGGRYLWAHFDDQRAEGGVQDLDGERPFREIPFFDTFHALLGSNPPRIAAIRADTTLSLHEPGGNQLARFDFPHQLRDVVPHPSGVGFIVAYDHLRMHPQPCCHLWAEVAPDGTVLSETKLEGGHSYSGFSMARASDDRMVFIRYKENEERTSWLAALGFEGENLRELYRVSLGERRVLMQDPEGRRVFAVGEGEDGVDVTPLGPEPPRFRDLGVRIPFVTPLASLWSCIENKQIPPTDIFVRYFKWQSLEEIARRAREQRAARANDRTQILALFWGLALSSNAEEAEDLARWLQGHIPDDPEVEQTLWAALVVQRKWSAVVELLDPMDDSTFAAPRQQHRHHVLAVARAALGDVERASEHLAIAKTLQGSCNLGPAASLVEAITDPFPDEMPVGAKVTPIREVLALVRIADRLLARGDLAGVVRLYERRSTFEVREAQGLARLATAHLGLHPTGAAEIFRKRFALATFVDALDERRVGFRVETVVPGATWTMEKIDAIAAEASAWLASSGY